MENLMVFEGNDFKVIEINGNRCLRFILQGWHWDLKQIPKGKHTLIKSE